MPLVTSYTEAELATFILDDLGPMAADLHWSTQADVQAVINQALRDQGVTDINQVSGAAAAGKLEAIASRALWRRVVKYLAVEHDFDADGQSFKRSQLQKQANTALGIAEAEAGQYGGNSELVVGLTTVHHTGDPYAYYPDELRQP